MRRTLLAALSAAALTSSLLLFAPSATAAPPPTNPGVQHRNVHVCDEAPAGMANCHAIRHDRVDASGRPVRESTSTRPAGYGADDIQSAYNLAALSGSGATVAIVDAYDDPNAERDLNVYRSQYGIPACTTANGCFRKVNQSGGSKMPRANGGWAQEISLDLDMVSAACPGCKILLVEASSASFANLGAAVNTAVNLGATAVSNSYGGSDTSAMSAYEHPGIAITASTGDDGYGVESPASFPHVIAVGGTHLTRDADNPLNPRGWSETVWGGAGSGCSGYNRAPAWQVTSCGTRKANADVAAIADPNSGVAVYDSYSYQGAAGWLVFGGTSAAAPIVAGVYAMGGNHGYAYPAQWTWTQAGSQAGTLNDVTSGSNGSCATGSWCTAGTGWDGPTGLGTPNGTSAF